MSLYTIDYEVQTNADWVDAFQIMERDPEDDEADPVPVDLTGCTFVAHIRTEAERLLVSMLASTDNGLLAMTDPENGKLAWNVDFAKVNDLDPGTYVYDMVWNMSGDREVVLAKGKIKVVLGVTR